MYNNEQQARVAEFIPLIKQIWFAQVGCKVNGGRKGEPHVSAI